MYKISVPLYNANIKRNNRERVLQELKRFDAERVFSRLTATSLTKTKKQKL